MAKKKVKKELSPAIYLVSKGRLTAVVLCVDGSERRVPVAETEGLPKITKEAKAYHRGNVIEEAITRLRVAFGDSLFDVEGA